MFIEFCCIAILVIAISVIAYRSAIHEFQILQKDYDPDTEWGELLSEQLPLVIRDIPASWLGGWTYGKTGNKTWPLYIEKDEKRFKIAWNTYVAQADTVDSPTVEDLTDIAQPIKLLPTFQNWGYDGMTRPWWLPVTTPTPSLFTSSSVEGLEKTRAAWTALVSTDGAPLELWVAHEGAIPDDIYEHEGAIDPWKATTAEYTWIGDVKYIEIKLRPGNALLLPRHWWYAVRTASSSSDDSPKLKAHGAWWWRGEFHSVTSRCVSFLDEIGKN